jgi:hypothetical protein
LMSYPLLTSLRLLQQGNSRTSFSGPGPAKRHKIMWPSLYGTGRKNMQRGIYN